MFAGLGPWPRDYVFVESRELQAVVDSGAEVSVLSSTHYFSLPPTQRPALQASSTSLVVADKDHQLQTEGVVIARITIKQTSFDSPLYVAPISDDLLLGSDILDSQDIFVVKFGLNITRIPPRIDGRWKAYLSVRRREFKCRR